ncbi:hypothetical protein ACIBCA_23830 [Kitasatospora sp. NPDC051170]|uniref:hypothetical protein n=1 Tax=Kitasatospora sp. NPDC051170 TaxID=3364056 RepID=UPI0037B771FC
MVTHPSSPPVLRADADETLDALVNSSRRLRRFWPLPAAADPQPAAPAPTGAGVRVSSGAQRVVAGMAEYGL